MTVVETEYNQLNFAEQKANANALVYAATGPDFYDYERELNYCWRNSKRNWKIFSTENYRKFWDSRPPVEHHKK